MWVRSHGLLYLPQLGMKWQLCPMLWLPRNAQRSRIWWSFQRVGNQIWDWKLTVTVVGFQFWRVPVMYRDCLCSVSFSILSETPWSAPSSYPVTKPESKPLLLWVLGAVEDASCQSKLFLMLLAWLFMWRKLCVCLSQIVSHREDLLLPRNSNTFTCSPNHSFCSRLSFVSGIRLDYIRYIWVVYPWGRGWGIRDAL